jgi:hypothetical protein
MSHLFLALITAFSFSTLASAEDFSAGREASERAQARMLQTLSKSQTDSVREGVNEMMKVTVDTLVELGHTREASRLQKEWVKVRAWLNTTEDLGDHDPLSKWLSATYNMVHGILGAKRMAQLHLDDIFVINYALPVVTSPQHDWGRMEYALHFIPFTGVVVFWAGMNACMDALAGQRGAFVFCERINNTLKHSAMNGVAPRLADFIYNKFRSY